MNIKLAGLALAGLLPLSVTGVAHASPSVRWEECSRPELPVMKGVECGRLSVPVDWSRPSGSTVALRVFRLKVPDSTGTILNFPSGPGQTGDLSFATLRDALPRYDLIALDPRGVGQSSPMTCDTALALKIPYVPPTDSSAFDALAANQSAFWKSCTTGVPGLDSRLDAYTNARDADALRQALGLKKISIHGFSYGTLTAERYLARYGRHVNGSLLEGVMNPAQGRTEFVSSEAAGMQAIFDRFTQWCADTPSCALHGSSPADVFRKAQSTADRVPGTLYGLKWSAVTVTRYFELAGPSDFGRVARGLLDLSEGRNPVESGPIEEYPKRVPYADPMVCQDFPLGVHTVAEARKDLESTRAAAPVLGFSTNASNYSSICLGGPSPAAHSSAPVSSRSAHPTLLLSNTLDPATPVSWASKVAEQLGPKALHVRTDQVGHGGGMDNPATLQKVRAYLDCANRVKDANMCS
ncbi:alpha/beta fold hydrolase [Lentzea sp. NPDC051838]|uniref:alpha/beta fold hydrolase n=1 Tax=Lentzea sp. NPDC051838 TaxID=3154849 RepID=UPI0034155628